MVVSSRESPSNYEKGRDMESMEVSTTCKWGRCHGETKHLVAHPIMGLVEVCSDCLDGWELGEDCLGDVEGGDDATVTVLDERKFARYFEIRQKFRP
jgi:hypothetical protein